MWVNWACGTRRQFSLAARYFAVEFRIAEKRRPHTLVAHLRRLALGVQLLVAHVTAAAGDLERNDDSVSDLEVTRFIAYLTDNSHRLVPEDVSRFHECTEHS